MAKHRPGFYHRRVFPWLNDKLTADPELTRIRSEALAAARGSVIEIGFGTGANLPHYSPAVERVVAIEPNAGMLDRAVPRVRTSRMAVDVVGAEAEQLPCVAKSFDTAVSTLTLCSVSDMGKVLGELRRVLRDDGQLIVIEHGLSPDAGVARWQQRLNGLERIVACGCNLNRPMAQLIEASGFRFDRVRSFYLSAAPRTHGWITVGAAVKA